MLLAVFVFVHPFFLTPSLSVFSYTHIPTILTIHLKRLILGKKIQTHVPFDTVLDMKPHLAPGQASPQTMELIGIISHQGTKEQGHYVTISKRGNDWISHNDAIVTQATLTQLHQTQAYIMIYRKMDHNGVTGTNGPKDSIMVGQQFIANKTDWKNQSVQSHWRHCLARHDYRWRHCPRPHDYRWRHDHRGHSGSFQTFRVFSATSTCVLRPSRCTIYIAIITVCDARTGGGGRRTYGYKCR